MRTTLRSLSFFSALFRPCFSSTVCDFQRSSFLVQMAVGRYFFHCCCNLVFSSLSLYLRMTRASDRRRHHCRRLPGRTSGFRLASLVRAERQFLCRLLRVKPVPRVQVSKMIGRRATFFRPVRLFLQITLLHKGLRPHIGRLGQARILLPP